MDLFCGTGTIGMFLSRKAKKVIGVEINQYAIEDAKKNAEMNGVSNIEFICDDATNVKLNGITTKAHLTEYSTITILMQS